MKTFGLWRDHTHTYTHTLTAADVSVSWSHSSAQIFGLGGERATLIYSRVVLSLVRSHVHTHRRARLHAHQPAVLHVVTTLLRVVDNVLNISQLQHRRQTPRCLHWFRSACARVFFGESEPRSLTARVLNWRWDGFHYAFPRFVSNNISQWVVVICQIRFFFPEDVGNKSLSFEHKCTNFIWRYRTVLYCFLFYRWCGG